jgi:antitoxin component YwqK of YwqJK toxin-antitoxin module
MCVRIFISFLILSSLGVSPLTAQSDTLFNQTDANNLKQGYWKKAYPNGKLMYKGYFKDNKPVGEMYRYFESGTIKALLNYDSKGEYAHARLFYEDKQLAAEGWYYNSLKDSTWSYYSYYEKTLTVRESYAKGARHGLMMHYYNNGDVSEKIEWKNDKKDGIWEQYFRGNVLKLKGSYINDKLEGVFLVYYEDGKPFVKGTYTNNQRNGMWTFYKEDGTLDMEMEYRSGRTVNEEKLNEKQKEFFRMIDENEGKFEEPDEINFLAPQGQ